MPAKRRNSTAASQGDRYVALFKALGQLKVDGRPVIELFTEIPDANMYPDYRDVVEVPISLAEIGKRVRVGAYESDDSLLADFELMAENAKAYNGEDSPVYDDATDILDFASLFLGRDLSRQTRLRLQRQIVNELEAYKYKGRKFSDAFIVEPDAATYPNYRDVVKKPTSFTKVRNTLEKKGPAESWPAFHDLVALIFTNAMLYNQEDSQIYNDAKALLKQLDNKMKKYSPLPKHLVAALPRTTGATESSSNEDHDDDDDEDEDDQEDDDMDMDEDDDDDEELEDSARAPPRYEDDDDEDFEADSEDMDEDEFAEGGANGGGGGGGDDGSGGDGLGAAGANGMIPGVAGELPPQFLQPTTIYDEIVYRPPDEGVEDALIQMVTCHSTPIPPHLQMSLPIEDVKRAENDMLQLRIPPSPSKAFTTYATTLPYYQSTLRLSVLPNRRVEPLQLSVLLNGAKLLPLPVHVQQQQWEHFEISLAPGLNQVTVIAIKSTYGGFIRQYGPPPLADAEPDEERMVLFLNLSK